MMRQIEGAAETCETLIQDATAALRRYHEAQAAGEPAAQIERLRLLAESAYQAVVDYQLDATGHQSLNKH
ncbi:hypothetical protein N7650_14720 [Pseudomonas sp. GD04058]|uniref:hypothetical protein n=1 Tax=Pseudomonas sp. GD04058 TaxID=2975429 RepID=UPI00244CB3D7|nr:hypothetical protein [Pseudomonas sp. GD04058]MDG9884090.1 hypothetical protein [Pseudomonas sp. GD04058]